MLWFSSKAAIEDVQAQNLICILDVDIQGVNRIKETDLNPIYISIQPPSMEILVNVHFYVLYTIIIIIIVIDYEISLLVGCATVNKDK